MAIVGIILTGVSFLGPWWSFSAQGSFGPANTWTNAAELRLLSGTVTSRQTWSCCFPNSTAVVMTTYAAEPSVGTVLDVASWLSGIALLSGAGMVALATLTNPRPSRRKLAPSLGILAGALLVAAALYVMIQLPGAAVQDGIAIGPTTGFWGSTAFEGLHGGGTASWGAGWCWYGILVAAGLFLVGAIVLYQAQRSTGAVGPRQPVAGRPHV